MATHRHDDHPDDLSVTSGKRLRVTLGFDVRTECLDWILIGGRRHLERVLRDYVDHYVAGRPHRGLDLKTPESRGDPPERRGAVHLKRRDVLGGLIHEYCDYVCVAITASA